MNTAERAIGGGGRSIHFFMCFCGSILRHLREKRSKYERQIGFEIKRFVMLLYNVNTLILCVCVCVLVFFI